MIHKKYKKFLEHKEAEGMWGIIPESVKELHKIFKKNSKKLYVVGGAVRDFLNNEKAKDFDLATDAHPEEVIKILQFHNYDFNLQGKAFGVVVVYTDDEPMGMEIATFREDVYDKGLGTSRNPGVKFTTIEKDVERRDTPFNAMFYDLDNKEIVDLVGGKKDIENKITKFVGDPDKRIIEDPLRILRVLRFSTRYNFDIEDKTKEAIKRNKGKLAIISRERIWEEFMKSWKQSNDFNDYLNFISEFDMWVDIFPTSNINENFINSDNIVIVLANLFKNEDTEVLKNKLVQDYKIPDSSESNKLATQILFLVKFLDFLPDDVLDFYKLKKQCRIEDKTIKEWLDINNDTNRYKLKFIDFKPSVSSQELMSRGFKGEELGKEIKRLEIKNFKN